ncbi:MAG: pantoate--beta-alanine ligase [Desulfobacterales bacterium]|nr:pantoate--beta-alanine ligase [Desulfobacterales bacterium]
MQIIRASAEMTAWSNQVLARGERIALVPTMGCFHQGHLALMRHAANQADQVVVSLFVNPIQFGPGEDLDRYPRDIARDTELAAGQGVAVLFTPEVAAMYPDDFQTRVSVDRLSRGLCGAGRPGHFEGVTTVVAKLFHLVKPHLAVFGEKDFQQLAVIRRMVADLDWDIIILGHPIVRETDGLAMSSRNTYLDPRERQTALCLYQSLESARRLVRQGLRNGPRLIAEIKGMLGSGNGVEIEYVKLVDQKKLTEKNAVDSQTRLLMAVRIGRTRLIDNGLLF